MRQRSGGWRGSATSPNRRRCPKGSTQIVVGEATFCLPLGSLIDLSAEAARLQKEIAKVTEEIARLHKKLSNEKFVANAPEEIVAAEREKLAEFRRRKANCSWRCRGFARPGESAREDDAAMRSTRPRIRHAARRESTATIFRRNVAIM